MTVLVYTCKKSLVWCSKFLVKLNRCCFPTPTNVASIFTLSLFTIEKVYKAIQTFVPDPSLYTQGQ